MEEIFLVLMSSALVNNIVVAHVIGTDPALVSTQRRDVARGRASELVDLMAEVGETVSIWKSGRNWRNLKDQAVIEPVWGVR